MSALETLPPDQRAVLQLILMQGRAYDELAGLLRIDVAAVRDRAHAGVAALASAREELGVEDRAQIADYLLGQQDDAARIVTLARLGESAEARRWAEAAHTRLAPLARERLPEVPAAPSTNGVRPHTPAPRDGAAGPDDGRPSSRLGGALLLAAIAALLIVLLVVLLAGGDGDGKKAAGSSTPTQAQSRTTPSNGTSTTKSTAASIVGQANLTAADGSGAIGIGILEQAGKKLALALQAQKLAPNGKHDIYTVWLQGNPGNRFVGFVPSQVGKSGTFAVSAPLPSNARSYGTLLVTREGVTAVPSQPGTVVLRGPVTWRASKR